ncbi:FitA-like ribbon-helix-helix domain-containing protein [Burkholderia catarinensis]|uniref:FitA-like ribbon-helix-helix domain-containing protein n=1 Tax=Burkholderia catarinensis TaxID=1108140 RepID=UPI000921C36F|nr:DNA-binding protein [Burkholderia catarinensis]KAG8153817.1 DNA-binding protein [Burkholderia catarinensis]
MANLLVRNVEDSIVQSLREQAAANGRSAEAEHRAILADALGRPKRRTFAQALMSMPEVGEDADFQRVQDSGEVRRVFD